MNSSYKYSDADDRLNDTKTKGESWSAGLNLKIPIYGDLTRKQRLVSSRINLKKTEINLQELKDNIEIEIQDLIRDVESKLTQLNLARLARELSKQKLEIEQ
jgi:outer membrane protein TolC